MPLSVFRRKTQFRQVSDEEIQEPPPGGCIQVQEILLGGAYWLQ
jgi:hypothetical protein